MMIRMNENRTPSLHKQIMALVAALLVSISPLTGRAEDGSWVNSFDMDGWQGESVILEDPQYFMPGCDEDSIPVITSDGKSNVKVNGVQSKNKLVKYRIPQQLLSADPDFLALMVEAEKYIGYPYVYGASNPDTGFDCSGFVCWVFNQSGVGDVGRRGANGLYSLCSEVSREDARPGDLVFFEGAACTGGCVGGPLTFENTYVARGAVRALMRGCDITHPDERVRASYLTKYNLLADKHISANSAMRLDDDIVEAMRKMEQMEEIVRRLPGYDCGSCGSPTCRTFAEDIVRGYCNEMDCIHILKEQLKVMAQKMVELAKTTRE